MNGTIEVDSTPQQGTCFTIRLPFTLAIINCLLVRMRHVVFSMPIDDVREIVSVKEERRHTVHGKQTFDVRGEFIPLVSIDDVFHWHDRLRLDTLRVAERQSACQADPSETESSRDLARGGKTMGLRVDELLGSQDIVIKSLSDNFMDIRGLSGASILGDGSVCLMLDVGTSSTWRPDRAQSPETEEDAIDRSEQPVAGRDASWRRWSPRSIRVRGASAGTCYVDR